MIEITGLNKSFGRKVLFKNYDSIIKNGEFVIFTGDSGCGKTTLLNMIGAIEPMDSGMIIVDGLNVSYQKNRTRLFREVYGFLFQNFALVENKTVEENLSLILPKYSSGVSIDGALEIVGLSGYQKVKVYTLSGGEQQRLSLARLVMKKCTIVLADEPTGSLDKSNASRVIEILQYLNEKQKTVVMVTHNDEIMKYGDRVVRI